MKKYLPKLILVVAVLLTISVVFTSCQKENPVELFYEGRRVYTAHDFEGAIFLLNKAIKIYPEYAEAYFLRGMSYLRIKNYEKAIVDFTSCIKYNPNHAEAFYWRGKVYYYLEDYSNAISSYNVAIKLDPDNTYYYYSRGTAYNLRDENDDLNKAIDDFRKGCELGDKGACKALKGLLDLRR